MDHTMYVDATGSIWWNTSAGGQPVEYIRADLCDEHFYQSPSMRAKDGR